MTEFCLWALMPERSCSMDSRIILQRFRGGRLRASFTGMTRSRGSGDGAGLTGLLLGGVRMGCLSTASRAASTRRRASLPGRLSIEEQSPSVRSLLGPL